MNQVLAAGKLKEINDYVRSHHERMEAQMLAVLIEVAQSPGICVYDIADKLGFSGAAASRNVTKLGPGGPRGEGLGLVHRFEDPNDRRNKRVQLTEAGNQFFSKIARILEGAV